MARTAKPELDKLKEKILTLTQSELEILIAYAGAVLDVKESQLRKFDEAGQPI